MSQFDRIRDGIQVLESKGIHHPTVGQADEAGETRRRIQNAASNTDGKARPKGGDQKSKARKSITDSVIDRRAERAKRNGVSVSTQSILDRLAKGWPDLHEKVQQGELSAAHASVLAGFGCPRISIPLNPEGATSVIVRRFRAEQIDELIRLLQEARKS
jgi:hypothetical protein